ESRSTVLWMRKHGVRFVPIYGRQAFKSNGRFKFWGGVTVEVSGGGLGLVDTLFSAAERAGVRFEYETRALRLLRQEGLIAGVEVEQYGRRSARLAPAVVLASGGFQSNVEWRARYLGARWDMAKSRGTWCNTGDGIRMAL